MADAIERNVVRGVLLTPEARVLLMRMAFPWHAHPVWIAPGGGIDASEAAEQALRRELLEETGRALEIGRELWRLDFVVQHDGPSVRLCERYFLVPTPEFEPRPAALEPHERAWLRGYRFWPVAELTGLGAELSPPELAGELTGLAARKRCVAGVLVRDGRILLGLRGDGARSHRGLWDVIGGHCEPHESDEKTLVRELREELDVVPTRYRSAGVHDFDEPDGTPAFRVHFFVVEAWSGSPRNRSAEHSALAWCDPAGLRDLRLASPRYVDILRGLG